MFMMVMFVCLFVTTCTAIGYHRHPVDLDWVSKLVWVLGVKGSNAHGDFLESYEIVIL